MGIKLWEELAAQGMIIGMDAAEVLAKKIDALTAANIDLTERVLYAERERGELKAELARKDTEGPTSECPSGGEHDWVREPEYCTKCLASREAE